MAQPVTITAWIDFLDPWSWVTTTRLERLAERYGDLVELEWRAFMAYPEKQVHDLAEWRKATVDWLEPAAAEPGLGFSLWATTNAPPTHSAPALAAALVAGEEDAARAPAYWRALFRAHFTENRTISDGTTLIAIAREVGIDEDGFAMGLRGRYTHYVKQVIEEHNAGAKRGVTATPAVVIGDEFLVRGSASIEQYLDLVDQVLESHGVTPPLKEPAADTLPESAAASGSAPPPESEPTCDPAVTVEATPEPEPAATAEPVATPEPEPAATAEPRSDADAAPVDGASTEEASPAKKQPAKKKAAAKRAPAKKSAAKKAPAKRPRTKKKAPSAAAPPTSSSPAGASPEPAVSPPHDPTPDS